MMDLTCRESYYCYQMGCRSPACREIARVVRAQYRERIRSGEHVVQTTTEHGTYTRYVYGCRCDECGEANRVYHRAYRRGRAYAQSAGCTA